jgi:poly(glycerol-phosphate) alpha-glucosyltransferase
MYDGLGSTKEQFDNEAVLVKGIIYEMINAGNADGAMQLLEQYMIINPADPEIKSIHSVLIENEIKTNEINNTPDVFGVLKNIETVFVLNRIVFGRIGIRDSVLRKVKMMEDVWNYRPLILTCFHNINHRQAHMWLQTAADDTVTMSVNTRILNVYDYFQNSYVEGLENKAVYKKEDYGYRYIETQDNVYDVYDGDKLIRREHYTGYIGSLRKVCNYENGKPARDDIYDDWGYLNSVREYDCEDENIFCVKYYTTNGELCLEAFYNHTDEENDEPDKLLIYDIEGNVKKCADRSQLAAICLEQIVPKDKFCVVIIEDGLLSKIASSLNIKKSNRAICEVVHNVFLKDPYDLSSEPQRFYKNLCENHSLFDGIILLTEKAKKDFEAIYGESKNIFVIQHPYPYGISEVDFDSRDNKKAVIVARLDPIKQLEHAIYIFSLVVKDVPDAKLEIYGRGEEEEKLSTLIKKLGLVNNVHLMGFTDNPISVMKTASLFMMTSMAEGYPSTPFESICNGCPVFSYDIKYGPSEIVTEGKTGFLFHRFDNEGFAKKIITFLKDKEMQRTMSECCYADAPRFSPSLFLDRWYDMMVSLYNRR